MYAVIETGGKQYKVSEGDVIFVEKLNVEEGAEITFDKVLMAGEGDAVKVGTPVVEGAKGAKTVFDIPPAYLSPKSGAELRKELL